MKLGYRMIIGSAVALLALVSLGAGSDALAQNLLVNGDFETGDLAGWEVHGSLGSASVTVVAGENGPTVAGTHAAYMDNQAEAHGLTLKQSTAVGSATDGEVFYAFDAHLIQADVGGVLFVEIWAEQSGVGIIGGSGLMGPFWDWDWTPHSGSFIAPAGTDFLTIQIMANTGANIDTNCIAYIDNVDINQGFIATESNSFSQVKALY